MRPIGKTFQEAAPTVKDTSGGLANVDILKDDFRQSVPQTTTHALLSEDV